MDQLAAIVAATSSRPVPCCTRIVLVDDHTILRAGLRLLLHKQPGLVVVGEAASAREALEVISRTLPDLVIMDVQMPDLDGISLARNATTAWPQVKILILSGFANKTMIRDAFKAGVSGYLLKGGGSITELFQAIGEVMSGNRFLDAALQDVGAIPDRHTPIAEPQPEEFTCSPEDAQMLKMLAEGMPPGTVAQRLEVSLRILKNRQQRLMEKWGCDTLNDLIRCTLRPEILEQAPWRPGRFRRLPSEALNQAA
jgi:two-component system response regulator NreC